MQEISLIIAAYNSGAALSRTLPANLGASFSQVIVVDAFSTDGTAALIDLLRREHNDRIQLVARPRGGLAKARNEGTAMAKTPLIMHAGPDNVIPQATLEAMVLALERYDLVSCQTELPAPVTYWEKAHSFYKRRFHAGEVTVVGTPYLARRELFESFPFNEFMKNSDDTELCQRLISAGRRIYRCQETCLEFGFNGPRDFAERWPRWGRGDSLYFSKMYRHWSWRRRAISLAHPFRAEIIWPLRHLSPREYFYCLPFLLLACLGRYWGWARHILAHR